MDKLWRKRKPPVPLDWDSIQKGENKINACLSFLLKKKRLEVFFVSWRNTREVVFFLGLACTAGGEGLGKKRKDIFSSPPPVPFLFFQPNSHSLGCLSISLFESKMALA